jgi:hypothetical protein
MDGQEDAPVYIFTTYSTLFFFSHLLVSAVLLLGSDEWVSERRGGMYRCARCALASCNSSRMFLPCAPISSPIFARGTSSCIRTCLLRFACVSIRPHTFAYVSRVAPLAVYGRACCDLHASAYVRIRSHTFRSWHLKLYTDVPAAICIRQDTSGYVRIRQDTSACVSMRQDTSGYVSMRQDTSGYGSIRRRTCLLRLACSTDVC